MLQFNRDTYSEANSPIKNRIERRRLAKDENKISNSYT